MNGALYKGEKVYDASNFAELLGNGKSVKAAGDIRLFSRLPPPKHDNRGAYSRSYGDHFPVYDRQTIIDKLAEQLKAKRRVSDIETWSALDQNGTPQCFPAGTLIRMADGSQKRIEDVKVLDMVVTAEGNVGRVMNTMAKWHDGVLMTPNCWGHSHLKCTPEHPILTKRGYVPVADLIPGVDKVAFPKYAAQSSLWLLTSNHIETRYHVRQTRRIRKYQIPGKPAVSVAFCPVPDIIHLTHDFGRVVGLFLAEGHSGKTTAHWSFNGKKELHTLVAETVEKLRETCGAEPRVRMRTAGNVAQVEVHGIEWARLFESLCAKGAANKAMHSALTAGPVDFLEGALTGWMDGDRNIGFYGVSISRELAMNMFDVANVLGKQPIISTHTKARTDKRGQYHRHSWKTGWSDHNGTNRGAEQDDTHLFRSVRRIDSEPFKGYVYNLSVEGDNSYVAEGMGVHNCWSNGVAGCAATVRVIMGLPYIQLSPASVAIPISGGTSGGYEGDAVRYGTEHGWAPSCLVPQHSTDRSLMSDPKVIASRKCFMLLEVFDCGDDYLAMQSCLADGWPCVAAYPDWSHVTEIADGVAIERGSLGHRARNSWSDGWGAKNDAGFGGYATFREDGGPHCRVDGIFALRQMTPSPGTEFLKRAA